MKSEIVKINGCKRHLQVEMAAGQLEKAMDELAVKYAAKARVPGFRPGKVPLSVIRQRYATELKEEAKQNLISDAWRQAVVEHDLSPLSEPRVEEVRAELGEPMALTVSFEVLPSVEITEYKGIAATLVTAPVSESDIEGAIGELRERHAQYVPVEEADITDGHLVTISLDGEFEDGGKPMHDDEINLVVGDSRTNEEFSKNLRGAHIGETRSFPVSFSPDHPRKRFAGKTVNYRLEINDVKTKQVPELNDDFARDIGAENLEALRTRTRDELVRKAELAAEEKAREEVLDRIVQATPFDVPECLVEEELEGRAHRLASSLAHQGIDIGKTSFNWKAFIDEARPEALKAVRQMLILDAIARIEGLQVNEADLEAEFEKLARASEHSAAALRAQFEKDQRIQRVRANLLRHMALDFIYRNANISRG